MSYNKISYKPNKLWIDSFKNIPCLDCGNYFPSVCMDFDHRPGEIKEFRISAATHYRKERILNEIKKCDVVCANCHRVRTHNRRLS